MPMPAQRSGHGAAKASITATSDTPPSHRRRPRSARNANEAGDLEEDVGLERRSPSRRPANWGSGDADRHDVADEGQNTEAFDMDASFVFDTNGETEEETARFAGPLPAKHLVGVAGGEAEDHDSLTRASSTERERQTSDGLLLPEHVQVVPEASGSPAADADGTLRADGPGAADSTRQDDEDDELGDYDQLDARGRGGPSRYYDPSASEQGQERRKHEVCIVCNEEGHEKRNCPHEQCLACGALDEHSSRDCPLGLSCFRCGGRGHRSKQCPYPPSRRGWGRECDRCGSTYHSETTCPTLWRIYAYNSGREYEEERARHAEQMDKMQEEHGGSVDERKGERDTTGKLRHRAVRPDWDPAVRWCYNCSMCGNHWGDDCPERRANPVRVNGEPSAFSDMISTTGPFARYLPPAPPVAGVGGLPSRHFDFAVGPSASMHLADVPNFNARQHDLVLDAAHFPQSQRQRRRDTERDASERARKRAVASNENGRFERSSHREGSPEQMDVDPDDWFASFAQRIRQGRNSSRHKAEHGDARASERRGVPRGNFNHSARMERERPSSPSRKRSRSADARDAAKPQESSSSKKRAKGKGKGSSTDKASNKSTTGNSEKDRLAAALRADTSAHGSAKGDRKLSRREQGERDRAIHREKSEREQKHKKKEGGSKGQPTFGRFSHDDRPPPGGSKPNFRPLYRGGYE